MVCFEFEAWPEPKALTGAELRDLYALYGSQKAVAQAIGVSRVFVTEKLGKQSLSGENLTEFII